MNLTTSATGCSMKRRERAFQFIEHPGEKTVTDVNVAHTIGAINLAFTLYIFKEEDNKHSNNHVVFSHYFTLCIKPLVSQLLLSYIVSFPFILRLVSLLTHSSTTYEQLMNIESLSYSQKT